MIKYCLIALALITAPVSTKEYDLGLQLEVGETYQQNFVSNLDMKQTIMGMEQNVAVTIIGQMDYRVESFKNDLYTFAVSYVDMGMKMTTPYGETEFSSGESDDTMSPFMNALTEKPFTMVLDRTGIVKDITGINEIFDGLADEFPDVPEVEKQQIIGQLKESYGDKAIKGNMEMVFAIYPEKKVAVGDHWSNEVMLNSTMSGRIVNDFSLTDVAKDHMVITGNSTISTDPEQEAFVTGNFEMTAELGGTMVSTIKVDRDTRWITEATLVQDIKGTMTMSGGELPQEMEVPFTMKQTMNVGDK